VIGTNGQFLAAALLAADSIGGKRGAGYGRLIVERYRSSCDDCHYLGSIETMKALQGHLLAESVRSSLNAYLPN